MSATYRMAVLGEESANQLLYCRESQVLVHMSPASYLRHCAPISAGDSMWWVDKPLPNSMSRSRVEWVAARLLAQLPLDAPFLDADPDTGVVISQEGRHRAVAAFELGIELIPVIIYARRRGVGILDESECPGLHSKLRGFFDEAPWIRLTDEDLGLPSSEYSHSGVGEV